MKILIDICHPGHVHLFKNLIYELKGKGNIPFITVRDIPKAKELLRLFDIEYIDLGQKDDSIQRKLFNQIKYNLKLRKIANEKEIDLAIGTSITIAHVSKISKVKSIIFDDDDDDVQPLMTRFGHPFADLVLSPEALKGKRKKKDTVFYAGFHELAYLHPKRFQPDPCVLRESDINGVDRYFVLRFNSFKAHHDVNAHGLSFGIKRDLVNFLKNKGKVIITTEREIEPEFQQYQLTMSPEKVHSLLSYATMFIGDSQTMTSEAAVLGIPAIRCNSFVNRISYLDEEEHQYGLTYGFLPNQTDKMFDKIEGLLSMRDLKEEWDRRRNRMLEDKIEVTEFFIWFVENYPESFKIMRENPEYQYNFR
jgi:uncharacterized protein